VDRKGQGAPFIPNPVNAMSPTLSPDGKRLAIIIDGNLWVYDLEGRPPIKLTSSGAPMSPLWTPDGKRIFIEITDPVGNLHLNSLASILSDGSSTTLEQASPAGHFHGHGWSSAGEVLAAGITKKAQILTS
jgi:Tol biopolymer transport system component